MDKMLNREEFLCKAEKLRRINWKMWFLLISFIGYALVFFGAGVLGREHIGGKDNPLFVLIFIPAIFAMEKILNGKSFRCPVCGEPFKNHTAELVIASGKCPACLSEILELPSQNNAVFERDNFIRYHRKNRYCAKVEWVVLGLSAVIVSLFILMTFPEIVYIFPPIRWFYRVLYYMNSAYLSIPIWVFALFMLAYLACRMHYRPARKMERCPHCGDRFDRDMPQIIIATGRCPHCSQILLTGTQPMRHDLIYRKSLSNSFAPEFHWLTQSFFAFALIVIAVLENPAHVLWGAGILIGFELLLVMFFQNRRRRCRHQYPSRLLKVSNHCRICGKDLSCDADLFHPVTTREKWIHLRDDGVWRSAIVLVVLLIVIGFESRAIPVLLKEDSMINMTGLALANVLFMAIPVGFGYLMWKTKNPTGIVLTDETLTIIGDNDTVIAKTDLVSADSQETLSSQDGKLVRTWRLKTVRGTVTIPAKALADPLSDVQVIAQWLPHYEPPRTISGEFSEARFTFVHKDDPELKAAQRKLKHILQWGFSASFVFGCAGLYWDIMGLFVIGAVIAIPLLLLLQLLYLKSAQRQVYKKYDGITFLYDGLSLNGRKGRKIPQKKIDKVSLSWENKNGINVLIAGFYIKPMRGMEEFQLRSDCFAEPEKFIAVCQSWRAHLLEAKDNREK